MNGNNENVSVREVKIRTFHDVFSHRDSTKNPISRKKQQENSNYE